MNHPVPPGATPSARKLYSVHPVHSRPLPKADDVEPLVHETRSACFLLSRCASETIFDPAEMSLGWVRRILGQKRALQGHRTVPRREVGEVV